MMNNKETRQSSYDSDSLENFDSNSEEETSEDPLVQCSNQNRYLHQLEKQYPWLRQHNDEKVFCKLCQKSLQPKKYIIQRHNESFKHVLYISKLSAEINSSKIVLLNEIYNKKAKKGSTTDDVEDANDFDSESTEILEHESESILHTICKVCMSTKCSKLYSIYDSYPGNSIKIAEMLIEVLKIPIISFQLNNLPEKICNDCLSTLKKSLDFQQMFSNSHKYFKFFLKNTKLCNSVEELMQKSDIELKSTASTEETSNQELEETLEASDNDNASLLLEISKEEELSMNEDFDECDRTNKKKNLVVVNESPQENSEDFNIEFEYASEIYDPHKIISEKNNKKGKDIFTNDIGKINVEPSKSCLEIHKRPRCDEEFQNSHILKNFFNTNNPELCHICGKTFKNVSILKEHKKTHTTEKVFQCPECPSKFKVKGYLTRHMRSHSEIKPFKCDICNSSYTRAYSLVQHKIIHTGVRRFSCEECGMKFFKVNSLKRHKKIHTGEKPYKCNLCDRAFTQSNDLVKHKRKHIGDNIYKCQECPMSFRLYSELKLHNQKHFQLKKLINSI